MFNRKKKRKQAEATRLRTLQTQDAGTAYYPTETAYAPITQQTSETHFHGGGGSFGGGGSSASYDSSDSSCGVSSSDSGSGSSDAGSCASGSGD